MTTSWMVTTLENLYVSVYKNEWCSSTLTSSWACNHYGELIFSVSFLLISVILYIKVKIILWLVTVSTWNIFLMKHNDLLYVLVIYKRRFKIGCQLAWVFSKFVSHSLMRSIFRFVAVTQFNASIGTFTLLR